MIDVSGATLVSVEQSYCAVVGRCNQFLSSWTELDIHNGGNVILVNVQCTIHLSHVKHVRVVIFVSNGEVECFHRVPRDGVGCEGKDDLGYRR